jgi:phosphatidylinositol-3-phosphatase
MLRTVCGAAIALGTMQAAQATVPRYEHVLVVIMENHGLTQIVGSSLAPYITSLSTQGANFTNSHGVAHPSEPNYIALFSGSTQGVTTDNCPYTFTGANNLGAQLIAAGLSFTGYSESMPSNGYTGCTYGSYARKHNPWVNFPNVPSASNLTYASFPTDYTTLPTVSVVVPNLNDDMHDGTVTQGDTWVHNNIDAYAQWAKTHNSLLILTFDEDDSSTSANLVPTIFVGAGVTPGNYGELINHYNVLTTIESMYGLPALNAALPISDVFGTSLPSCNATVIDGAAVTCAAAGLSGYTGTAYTHVYSTYTGGGACTQATAPGYDTSGCTISGGTSLTKGVAVTNIAEATGASTVYTFVVPSGASNLTFKTSGGTGDMDLYVKLGSAPTTSSYGWVSDGSTTTESITVASPTAGTYYVMVYGYASASGVSLVADYSTSTGGGNVLTNNVAVTGITLATGASKTWTMVVPSGTASVNFSTSSGSGDSDLYVQLNAQPTTSSYLKRSIGSTTAESITISAPTAGTYYVMVYGYSAPSGVTLLGKY